MSDLKQILTEIKEYSTASNRHALTATLRHLMDHRREYYHQGETESLMDGYTDALYKILLLELDEEEEDSIETAELAYMGISSIITQSGTLVLPRLYKRRLLLVHYFCDYLTDSVIEVFLKKHRAENLLQARSLAIECLGKMQLSDMLCLEDNTPEYLNGDEQLTDACNTIETDVDLSENGRNEALLLHNVMYAYLKAKYQKELP